MLHRFFNKEITKGFTIYFETGTNLQKFGDTGRNGQIQKRPGITGPFLCIIRNYEFCFRIKFNALPDLNHSIWFSL